tara:strand:- start:4531 stop:5034 length:504 start_codon:yes stop_codon:yes gene_type:complete
MTYISEQLLKTSLSLEPKDFNNDINNIIKHNLKDNIEGKCHEDGYIIKDSIQIIKRDIGRVMTNNGRSIIKFLITYKARLIYPTENDIINIWINNINKMGVIGYIKVNDDDSSDQSPLIVMVPREYFEGSSKNIHDLTIGQRLDIVVIGSRIKYHSDNIQVIAKPLD